MNLDTSDFDIKAALTLDRAREIVVGEGLNPPTYKTLIRWIEKGCRPSGVNGPALKFPVVKINGKYHTMLRWVREFNKQRLNAIRKAKRALPVRTKSQRDHASRQAIDELRAMGVNC